MKIHDIPKPKRRRRELLVPLGVGVAVGTFGLGVDGVADAAGGDYGLNHLFGADTGGKVTTALSPEQFALETLDGVSDSIHDHISTIAAPSDAAHALGPHTAEVFNPAPSVNTVSEAMAIHAVHGADRIQEWATSSQNGTFFNAKHAHELGQGLTAAEIGEGTGKGLDEGIERVPKLCD
ncbi:hypothetical protein M407DRAFT_34255 [Tulasnella calospora MUT 4182]|nr:hypothetical protein M407DRAFT_34255 [Tulasnella calospora MUT 4182]